MRFEVRRVSTEYVERMKMRPKHSPIGLGVASLVSNSLEDVEHVLEVASFQLETITACTQSSTNIATQFVELECPRHVIHGGLRGTAVESWSLTGELYHSCARPTSNG